MRSLGAALAAVALVVVLAGCGGHGSGPSAASRSTSSGTPSPTGESRAIEAWHDNDGRPISPIIAAGDGVGVVYIKRHGVNLALAIDLATGREVWTKHASTTLDGDAAPVSVARGEVIGVELAHGGSSYVAGLVPRTGRKVWASPRWKQTWSLGWAEKAHRSLTVVGDGRIWVAPARKVSSGTAGRRTPFTVYHGLADGVGFTDDSMDAIRLVEHGKVTWRRTNARIRPGWRVASGLTHVWHGRVLVEIVRDDAGASMRPQQMAVVALDAADGRPVWSRRATELCAMMGPSDRPDGVLRRYETFCSYRGGTLANPRFSDGAADVDATTLVGIDIVTGRTTWRHADGHRIAIGPTSPDGTHAYLTSARGGVLTDMASGTSAPAPDDLVVWQPRDFFDEPHRDDFIEHPGLFVPTRSGTDVEDVPWPLPAGLGASDGAIHAITTSAGVTGYRAGPAGGS